MELPQTEMTPNDPKLMPPARRRRARRLLTPLEAEERDAVYERLARRASPSFDFFVFSIIAGLILGTGLALDEPILVVLGAALAPMMAPVIGVGLGTAIGSFPFFFRSLIGFLVGCLFVFGLGAVGGYVAKYGLEAPVTLFYMARLHAQLSWLYIGILSLGTLFTAASLSREGIRAQAYSVILAYGLYVPLSVAGFGLTADIPHLWPDALVVFALHFAASALVGALILGLLGYRPRTIYGYSIGGALLLAGVLLGIGFGGAGVAVTEQVAIPTFTPTLTLTPTITPTSTLTPTITPSLTPTQTSTATLTPTFTPTQSPIPPTPTPTPVLAIVNVPGFDGARIRETPQGPTITVIANGTVVQLFADSVSIDGVLWYHVLTPDGVEGWIVGQLLNLVTPTPGP